MTTDPTAIDIAYDPRTQRMSGIAVHGNAAFDVPYITQITDTLWMGGCRNGLVLPDEIGHVVSLYPWERYDNAARCLKSRLEVCMFDSLDGPDRGQINALADWVNHCQETGPVLVHCQAGLNRSGLVTAWSMVAAGEDPDVAVEILREKRSPAVLCNPVFEAWVLGGHASQLRA